MKPERIKRIYLETRTKKKRKEIKKLSYRGKQIYLIFWKQEAPISNISYGYLQQNKARFLTPNLTIVDNLSNFICTVQHKGLQNKKEFISIHLRLTQGHVFVFSCFCLTDSDKVFLVICLKIKKVMKETILDYKISNNRI